MHLITRNDTHTPRSVRLRCMRDQLVPGTPTHNPCKRAAADQRLRPCEHQDRRETFYNWLRRPIAGLDVRTVYEIVIDRQDILNSSKHTHTHNSRTSGFTLQEIRTLPRTVVHRPTEANPIRLVGSMDICR